MSKATKKKQPVIDPEGFGTIKLKNYVIEELKKIKKNTGIPYSRLIQLAVAEYIQK